jgi:hypothetical protein
MPNGPTNAVHLAEVTRSFLRRNTFEAAQKFISRETKLVYQRMSHP